MSEAKETCSELGVNGQLIKVQSKREDLMVADYGYFWLSSVYGLISLALAIER